MFYCRARGMVGRYCQRQNVIYKLFSFCPQWCKENLSVFLPLIMVNSFHYFYKPLTYNYLPLKSLLKVLILKIKFGFCKKNSKFIDIMNKGFEDFSKILEIAYFLTESIKNRFSLSSRVCFNYHQLQSLKRLS